jgi:1-acyl-sn-glycerol-3-phosphate acyltransferase
MALEPGMTRPGQSAWRTVDRCWRVCATGLCFSGFGMGGLLLHALVFPLLRLTVRQEERRARIARMLIHHTFRAFVRLMRMLGVASVEVRGADKLHREGLLVLANHPSLIDVVLLMALLRGADCIVKSSLAHNVFTRGPVRAAGYVCNDSGAGLVDDCIASLRAGNNLIIFPEGTRTPRAGAARLQRGAANVAIRGGVDVTPVRITVSPPTLAKGDKWYRIPEQRAHFLIEVGDDIAVSTFIDRRSSEALAARRLTDHLAHYFAPETARAA